MSSGLRDEPDVGRCPGGPRRRGCDGAAADLPARCLRGGRTRLLPAARALGPRRRRSVHARKAPGGAAPCSRAGGDGAVGARGAARPLPARARARERGGPLLVRRARRGRAARLAGVLDRAGVRRCRRAWRRPTWSWPCWYARWRAARVRRARLRARPLVTLGRSLRPAREPARPHAEDLRAAPRCLYTVD